MLKSKQYVQRRDCERIESNIQVKFFYGNSVYFGTATNISENGMFVRTKTILFPLTSQFEVLILSNNSLLKIPVKVIRLETTCDLNYGMGVEILNTPIDYLGFINVIK